MFLKKESNLYVTVEVEKEGQPSEEIKLLVHEVQKEGFVCESPFDATDMVYISRDDVLEMSNF